MSTSDTPIPAQTGATTEPPAAAAPDQGRAALMLTHATIGFVVNFWAWALLSPIGPYEEKKLHLSSAQESLLVAIPVIVGSLGRIPIGALTDKFGGRVMFPVVSFATIVPVLLLGFGGQNSLAVLLVGGFFLGIGGTAFAVGVPFVNAWYPPARRGFAVGVFGAGMGGTAISALTTIKLIKAHGFATPFVITAIALAIFGVVAIIVMRDAPGRVIPTDPFGRRLVETAKLPITWRAALLYAVGFGGYVSFSVYLPTYLQNAYQLTQTDASNKMAGFVLVAVVMRPVGGWLSDRVRPIPVLIVAFAVVAAFAFVQSSTPSLSPTGTIAFLVMAAALGAASGAVFALVAELAPANKVGSVTGLVGAAGGLGGFVPPLVMGSIWGRHGSYTIGLILLGIVALLALVLAAATGRMRMRTEVTTQPSS
ncbi:MAG TPA: MFS transporter [Jatrophihabitantaceae bacterium]